MFELVAIDTEDKIKEVNSWYRNPKYGFNGDLPWDSMPMGWGSQDKNGLCAVAFPFQTDSKSALINWSCGNPNISRKARVDGLVFLYEKLENKLKEKGYKYIFQISNPKSLTDFLTEKAGFTNAEQASLLIKRIGEKDV